MFILEETDIPNLWHSKESEITTKKILKDSVQKIAEIVKEAWEIAQKRSLEPKPMRETFEYGIDLLIPSADEPDVLHFKKLKKLEIEYFNEIQKETICNYLFGNENPDVLKNTLNNKLANKIHLIPIDVLEKNS